MGMYFINGKSTQPDVDAIMAAIAAVPGTSVSHAEVASVAGFDPRTNRFRTVTTRWRRLVERGSAIRVQSRDQVFHFLTADEAHDRSRVDLPRVGRAAGKLQVRVAAIDPTALSGERRSTHFILARETAALLDSARRSAKAIQAPPATKPANLRLAQ